MQTTRFAAISIAAAASLALAATLSGCSSSAGGGTDTLANAKAMTLSIESKMVTFIPKSEIVSINQPKQSKVIFPCLHTTNESYWPSTMTVALTPGANTSNLLDTMGNYWTSKSGWSVSNGTAPDGTPTMTFVSKAGYNLTAEVAQGPVFTVTALSECFPSAGLSGKSSY